MKKFEIFSCEKCGELFWEVSFADEHERACLPLEAGQKVKFLFGLVPCEGRITALNPPVLGGVGTRATVDIETDIEVTEVDQLHDGKHVWVKRDDVFEIL